MGLALLLAVGLQFSGGFSLLSGGLTGGNGLCTGADKSLRGSLANSYPFLLSDSYFLLSDFFGFFVYSGQTGMREEDAGRYGFPFESRLLLNPSERGPVLFLSIKTSGRYSISLYDVTGRFQRSLFEGELKSGRREISLSMPGSASAGVYFVLIEGCGMQRILKFLYLR